MTPHDEIVAALLDVPGLSIELRLLGRVADDVVGNQSDSEVFLFVPDLHVVTEERQKRFANYAFNHAANRVLARLLQRLAKLRADWDDDGQRKLVTVQLGDFFDLWREFPSGANPGDIPDEAHGELRDVLYRGVQRHQPCLKATMLLGNHDTKRGTPLAEIPFQLKAFNRTASGEPFLFTTHGDAFDVLEILVPDAIEEFIVQFVGSLTPVNKYPVADWGAAAAKTNKSIKDLENCITEPLHDLTMPAGAVRVRPGDPLPAQFARTVAAPQDAQHGAFEKYHRSISVAAQRGLDAAAVRVVVVGHSHAATMILCRPPADRPLLMMDAGAWIEQCTYPLAEGGTVTEPSAQLGVIHGNDVRLYQVRVT